MSARWTVTLALAAALSVPARADIIILINHVEYRGEIVSEETDRVVMLSDGEEHKFFRDMIASLKYDKVTTEAERNRNKRRAERDMHQSPVKLSSAAGSRTASAGGSLIRPDSGSVTVYGTAWCGYCKRARALLRQHNVPFADKNVETNMAAEHEMIQKCHVAGIHPTGVPVIDAFGTMIAGYNERMLTDAIKQHGY